MQPSNPELPFSLALLITLLGLVKSATFSPWPPDGILSAELLLTYVAQADAAAQTTWNLNDRQAQSLISVFIHQDMQHL